MAELPFKKIKNSSSLPNAPGSLNALARDKSLDAKGVKHSVLDECDKIL
jgi:hypothetical protein